MSKQKEAIDSIGLVLRDVVAERLRQEQKGGPQDHKQIIWMSILTEEVGEAAQAINDHHFKPGMHNPENFDHELHKKSRAHIREELIQVAAVAVAMVESLDRNGR